MKRGGWPGQGFEEGPTRPVAWLPSACPEPGAAHHFLRDGCQLHLPSAQAPCPFPEVEPSQMEPWPLAPMPRPSDVSVLSTLTPPPPPASLESPGTWVFMFYKQ